jgi:hypothetical protein
MLLLIFILINKHFMNSKAIIISTIVIFFMSSLFLAWSEKRQSDENFQKDWWVLSFDEPRGSDINFTIANHSQKTSFHWEVISGAEKMSEGEARIAKGSIWKSDIKTGDLTGKITIRISVGSDKKEIYKNL